MRPTTLTVCCARRTHLGGLPVRWYHSVHFLTLSHFFLLIFAPAIQFVRKKQKKTNCVNSNSIESLQPIHARLGYAIWKYKINQPLATLLTQTKKSLAFLSTSLYLTIATERHCFRQRVERSPPDSLLSAGDSMEHTIMCSA